MGTDEGRFCGGGNCGEFGARLATSERSGNNPLLSIQLVSFWEWRLSVLEQAGESERREEVDAGLSWFIAIPFISTKDAIQLGCRTLRLISGAQRTPTISWDRIRVIAEQAPEDSFELTELLVEQTLKGDFPYLPFDEAGPPLRSALYCGNEAIRDRARRLIHRLGDRGLFEYQQLLGPGGTAPEE